MSVTVNTNTSATSAVNGLNKTHKALDSIFEKLASGKRINSAKDDAAGLQISDRLYSQISGYNQAYSNANDSLAYSQIAEGALSGTTDALQRMRTLSVQSSNGTYSNEERSAMQEEFNQLASQVDSIANTTTYAGEPMLDGSVATSGGAVSHVGPNSGDTLDMSSAFSGGFSMSQLISSTNQSGNSNVVNVTNADGVSSQTLDISSQGAAESTIASLDSMIGQVDSARASIGAYENRLESTMSNLSSMSVNTADAASRIADADYAEETSNLAAASILEKIQTSVATMANAKPKTALSLLS